MTAIDDEFVFHQVRARRGEPGNATFEPFSIEVTDDELTAMIAAKENVDRWRGVGERMFTAFMGLQIVRNSDPGETRVFSASETAQRGGLAARR